MLDSPSVASEIADLPRDIRRLRLSRFQAIPSKLVADLDRGFATETGSNLIKHCVRRFVTQVHISQVETNTKRT